MAQKYKNFLSMPIGGVAVLTVEMLLIIMLNIVLFGNLEITQEIALTRL